MTILDPMSDHLVVAGRVELAVVLPAVPPVDVQTVAVTHVTGQIRRRPNLCIAQNACETSTFALSRHFFPLSKQTNLIIVEECITYEKLLILTCIFLLCKKPERMPLRSNCCVKETLKTCQKSVPVVTLFLKLV